MYRCTDFDRQFLRQRAAQFSDPLERWQSGQLDEDRFQPLRRQSGRYDQRHAPMLRVAAPYSGLSSRQLRMLAHIEREFDRQDAGPPTARGGFGHSTTRQNLHIGIVDVEAVFGVYRRQRRAGERFIGTVRRLGAAALPD